MPPQGMPPYPPQGMPPQWAPPPGIPPQQGPQPGGGRKLALILGAAGVVLVLVAVGAFFAIRAMRDGGGGGGGTKADPSDNTLNGSIPLAQAATSEPEEVWSFHLDDSAVTVTPAGDRTYLSWGGYSEDETLTVTGLDDHGEESWSITRNIEGYVTGPADGSDILYVVPYADSDGVHADIQAVSGDDGTTLWTTPGGNLADYDKDALFIVDDDNFLQRRDAASGELDWEKPAGDTQAYGQDQIFIVTGDTLTSYDPASGDQNWTADTSLACEQYGCYATAADGLVLVGNTGTDRATALDSEDGSMLWAEDGYGYDHYVGTTGGDLVYIQTTPDSTSETDGEVVFYDTEGEVGRLPVAVEDYWFYGSAITIDRSPYVMDWTTSTLYDPLLGEVMSFDGPMAFASGGVYQVVDDELSYQHLGDEEQVWSIALTGTANNLQTADDAVLVVGTDAITRYE